MDIHELFFGRSVEGRPPVSEGEWESFLAEIVTPRLPGGFTVIDGYGQWRDPATGAVGREPTKILIVATPPTDAARRAVGAVRKSYERRFDQQSVGVITRAACADFAG